MGQLAFYGTRRSPLPIGLDLEDSDKATHFIIPCTSTLFNGVIVSKGKWATECHYCYGGCGACTRHVCYAPIEVCGVWFVFGPSSKHFCASS